MTLRISNAGLQTTIQAMPRRGQRHLGVPACGAADSLSLALANRLVGNDAFAPALETTLTGAAMIFEVDAFIAISGASAEAMLNGGRVELHRTLPVGRGDELRLAPTTAGARNYIAIAGGIEASSILGSASTYLPAKLGGHEGRALRTGDVLALAGVDSAPELTRTPEEFRLRPATGWALRACTGAEFELLDETSRAALFDTNFSIGRRADRMGLQLEGLRLASRSSGRMPSAPVFPGTVQCPEDGLPFLLSVDAQTTGGYPRLAQVARVDRHLAGQLRPGDSLRLLRRTPEAAIADLQAKLAYWARWLPDIQTIL